MLLTQQELHVEDMLDTHVICEYTFQRHSMKTLMVPIQAQWDTPLIPVLGT